MKFNVGIKTFSISSRTKEIFEKLDLIRPKDMSFSTFLAVIGEDYLTSKQVIKTTQINPCLFDDMHKWKADIQNMSGEELSNLQKRLSQLQNIVDHKVRNILC